MVWLADVIQDALAAARGAAADGNNRIATVRCEQIRAPRGARSRLGSIYGRRGYPAR
jgi:hypothetical protein